MTTDRSDICISCSRRAFLKCGAAACLVVAGCGKSGSGGIIPVPAKTSPAAGGKSALSRVVAVNDDAVTSWNGSAAWYGSDDFVRQDRLDEMLGRGMMELTGQGSESGAWSALLPGYEKGRKISIKPNANNAGAGDNFIDPLPQLLKSLVRGLKAGGVSEPDIRFLEPSRTFDDRVAGPVKSAYPDVTFYGASATDYSSACTYDSADPGLLIAHAAPGLEPSRLPDQLGQSAYLIHMPILKAHGMAGVTLTYKNLFGLFETSGIPQFHNQFFNSAASPFVEIFGNGNVGGKTVLIVGDAVYGSWQNNFAVPRPWSVFGDNLWPKRIFLSRDPVAVDSVMYDFLQWQRQDLAPEVETYLIAAAGARQGTRDHWNNADEKKYGLIDFVQMDITQGKT